VAVIAVDPTVRAQAEMFKHVERPAFPFRVFALRDQGHRWARERCQLKVLKDAPDPDR
jgi:hypothetical protein